MNPLTFNLDDIRQHHAQRLLAVRQQDDLIICNYTQNCTFSGAWNNVTMQCRGLILRLDAPYEKATRIEEVVALPFAKFFNLGENGRYPDSPLVEVAEKMDGSLGILYRHNGEYRVATRGSFDSEQARWATAWIQENKFLKIPDSITLMFEIIYPGNRVVVDYGQREQLVVLAARDRFSGQECRGFAKSLVAEWDYFGTPEIYHGYADIADLVQESKTLDASLEGWVCRFADGSRFKIKGQGYLAIHRLIMGLSQKRVIEAMIDGSLTSWLATIPEEFLPEVRQWEADIQSQIDTICECIEEHYALAPKESRKEYALYVKDACPSFLPHMFLRLDGRDYTSLILKGML